jgi:hypothetical protein
MGREGGAANRLVGSDLRLNLKRRLDVDALWMRSDKEGLGSGQAWRGGVNYDSPFMNYVLSYTSLGKGFRDEVGFAPRLEVDILETSGAARLRPTKGKGFILEYRPELAYTRFTKDAIGFETERLSPTLHLDFADASTVQVSYRVNEEVLTAPFRVRPTYSIPVGRYRYEDGDVQFSTTRSRRLALNGAYRFGEFWNGRRHGVTAGTRVRFNAELATTVAYSRDTVDLPGSSFDTDLLSLRIDGSFSTRMFLNAFIQYNSVNEEVVSNVRFNFTYRPLSDIYVVLNETRPTSSNRVPSRSLVLKMTRLLSF